MEAPEFQNTVMREAFLNMRCMQRRTTRVETMVRGALRRGIGRMRRHRWWAVLR